MVSISGSCLRKMLELRVALVRAFRRFRIKPQRGIIQFLESNFARVEAHHGIFADHAEESPPLVIAGACLVFEAERCEQRNLRFGRQLKKALRDTLLRISVEPRQSSAEAILRIGIARYHEVDELRHARFL